tara:strand:- start:16341 stop:17240 length:900 start_codon:yes stop_codon:yes gene_type:complete
VKIEYSKKIVAGKKKGLPILALESSIIAQGMPYPDSFEFAKKAESVCESLGVIPAMVAIINGKIHVGLNRNQLEYIAKDPDIKKVSKRELGIALSKGWSGATTVSSTTHIARIADIEVFSTGGIGGVHRQIEHSFDVSQDLVELSKTPIVIVSSGAKSILDLPKTVELLETLGITVLGYKTNEFPSFYSRSSGIKNIQKINSVKEIIDVYGHGKAIQNKTALLVTNPVPRDYEIPTSEIETIIKSGLVEQKKQFISGKRLTPFLLEHILKKTGGKSLKTNISLALNNIKLGAKIAKNLL